METAPLKQCTGCKLCLPLSCYTVQESNADGLRYQCKTCLRAYNSVYQAKRRAQRLAAGIMPRKPGRKAAIRPDKPAPDEPTGWPLPGEASLEDQLLHLHVKRAYGAVPGAALMGRL